MKEFLVFIITAVFGLILEATFLGAAFNGLFGIFGLGVLKGFCADTTFILCLYIALTRSFSSALLLAFFLGWLRDLFVLSSAWLDPFIFFICALVSNILKTMILLKGVVSFAVFVFFASTFYVALWAILAYNISSVDSAYSIGFHSVLQHSTVNALFSLVLYPLLLKFDRARDTENGMGGAPFGIR